MRVTVDYFMVCAWFAFADIVDFAITPDGKGVMWHKDLELDHLQRIRLTALIPEIKGLSLDRLSEINATGGLKTLLHNKLTETFSGYEIEVI